jgi:mannose-6-phosphate isomerase-like protein (cupin superfamily)
MIEVQQYIASGILEAYINGELSPDQQLGVEEKAKQHNAVRKHLAHLSIQLEIQLQAQAIEPPKALRAVVLAAIDYMDRIQKGERPVDPPPLHSASTAKDYQVWLDRPDFHSTSPVEDMFIKIISRTSAVTTAVVWMQEMLSETHTDEVERFLIVEGTCTVYIGNAEHHLVPGDVMTIPIHQQHRAVSTSLYPCKIILQRIAV